MGLHTSPPASYATKRKVEMAQLAGLKHALETKLEQVQNKKETQERMKQQYQQLAAVEAALRLEAEATNGHLRNQLQNQLHALHVQMDVLPGCGDPILSTNANIALPEAVCAWCREAASNCMLAATPQASPATKIVVEHTTDGTEIQVVRSFFLEGIPIELAVQTLEIILQSNFNDLLGYYDQTTSTRIVQVVSPDTIFSHHLLHDDDSNMSCYCMVHRCLQSKQAIFVYRTTLDPFDSTSCVHDELGSILIEQGQHTFVRCLSRWRPSTLINKPFHAVLGKITAGTNKFFTLWMDRIHQVQNMS